MAVPTAHNALKAFHNNVDDIRNLASCKICLRPFYEPFMLGCGHTFCYGCLRNWVCGGESRKKNKSCPECRAEIREQPAPNYALRDLAHMFTDRAELLPANETLEEHKTGKIEEARLLAEDRQGPGLFKNMFMRFSGFPHMPRSIWDPSDGVNRCPVCTWELEEGFCSHCGFDAMQDSMGEDFSDEDEDIDDNDESLDDESSISIRMPYGSVDGIEDEDETTPGPRGTYDATDTSETNTDTDPYPWGYRSTYSPHRGLDETDDDDDDEDDEEDFSDDMGDFIDDRPYDGEPGLHEPSAGQWLNQYHPVTDFDYFQRQSGTEDENSNLRSYADGVSHTSDEDTTMPLLPMQPVPKRRRLIISDDEDDDEENIEDDEEEGEDGGSDHFEDAVTGHETDSTTTFENHGRLNAPRQPNNSSTPHVGGQVVSDDSDTDHDDNDDDDDDDDDDEPVTAHRHREQARQLALHTAHRAGSRSARNTRPISTAQTNSHGYHPYTRPRNPSESNNRYSDSDPRPRGNSRTTFVF